MDVFVCGTDTSCGKTVVTACLARKLAPGVAVIKPAQTGCPPDDDAAWIASVVAVAGVETYVWERFREPLAPAVCADRENRALDIDDLVARTLAVAARHRVCEPAGGLLAPLAGDATMADLAVGLGWPVVVATRPGLGAINHTALTIEACERRNLSVRGIVVSGYKGGTTEDTNLVAFERLAPILGVVPFHDAIETSIPPLELELWEPA